MHVLQEFKSLEISSGLCTFPAAGNGPVQGAHGGRKDLWLVLGDMERLNWGSAAGTGPLSWRRGCLAE